MTVADPGAEGGGTGDVLPVGCLEAGLLLLLPLPLLVPLLHLALAHPAWGQSDGVITAHYGSCGKSARNEDGEVLLRSYVEKITSPKVASWVVYVLGALRLCEEAPTAMTALLLGLYM